MSVQVRDILNEFISDKLTYTEAKDRITTLYRDGYLGKSSYEQYMGTLYDINMVM